jgi:Xaa-Pro dipeptidase
MALHFTRQEFAARKEKLLAALAERKLDGMLMFQQESMYWLTGYDTFGFCFFQCLVLMANGRMALLTRSADLLQAKHTSILDDIRIWTDGKGATPAGQLRDLVADLGGQGKRFGVEYESYGLVASNGRALDAAFDGFATLTDASHIVTRLRAVKSAVEIDYVRKAAELGDVANDAALALISAGADEGDILGAMHEAIFRGGGDYPANEFIIGSGADALLCRYKAGRRKLDAKDQITLEFAGVYRHYHSALMTTVCVGEATKRHVQYFDAAKEALAACADAMRPGRTAGDVFAAHARVFGEHGLSAHQLNACGYSLGAKFTPSWMDWPMFYKDNDWPLVPGMVMFAHMILMDAQTQTAMCLGRTYLLTQNGSECLSRAPIALAIKQ